MHSKAHNINPIRWQRWSRAKWAVFVSIGRTVVIGVLSVSVCYAAMRKNNVVTATDVNTAESSEFTIDDDSGPDEIATLITNYELGITRSAQITQIEQNSNSYYSTICVISVLSARIITDSQLRIACCPSAA